MHNNEDETEHFMVAGYVYSLCKRSLTPIHKCVEKLRVLEKVNEIDVGFQDASNNFLLSCHRFNVNSF